MKTIICLLVVSLLSNQINAACSANSVDDGIGNGTDQFTAGKCCTTVASTTNVKDTVAVDTCASAAGSVTEVNAAKCKHQLLLFE